jgi:hypothetical protein
LIYSDIIIVGENMETAYHHEPDPEKGDMVILPLVLNDLQDRALMGHRKYGTYLMSHNGRDPLWDAYEEALDLVMYLRQAIEERDNHA